MKKLLIVLLCVAAAIGAAASVNRAPITEQPEGTLVTYNRSGNAVYVAAGVYTAVSQSGEMDIVYDPDGTTVYLKNIVFKSDSIFGDYWVEGELNADGTAISVSMGQKIYRVGTTNTYVKLAWGSSTYRVHNGEQYFSFNVDEGVNRAIYSIDGNTITLQNSYTDETAGNPEFKGTGLGCVLSSSNESFGGFMEWNTVLTGPPVSPTVITDIPESCTVHLYKRNSAYISRNFNIACGTNDGYFKVAFDNDNQPDVYIQNPIWRYNSFNTWVKGSYDRRTKIITIPTGQYLYWWEDHQYGSVLGWGSSSVYSQVDENGEEQYYVNFTRDSTITEIKLKLDGDNIYLLGTQGDIIHNEYPSCYNATGMVTYWSDDLVMTSLEFSNRDESGDALPWGIEVIVAPNVPANPTADEWYDCEDESGYSKFYFTLPTTDINGNVIIQDSLSYSIYLDNDRLFTFDANSYSYNLTEDVTEITYDIWNQGYDFNSSFCYFYRTNAEGYEPFFNWRIGIQVHYTMNGVKNSSDIVYLEVFPNPNVLLGDVNGDELIDINDVTDLIDYLLGQSPDGFNPVNADVDQDEEISINDVTALIDMLLGL